MKAPEGKQAANIRVGAFIRGARVSKGYSLNDFERLTGYSFSYLGSVERGRFSGASEACLSKIADALSLDRCELYCMAHRMPARVARLLFESPELMKKLYDAASEIRGLK